MGSSIEQMQGIAYMLIPMARGFVYELAPPQPIHVTTHVLLDGKKVAENTTEHQARSMSSATARGAAPRYSE